jgi:hypothetical protein
VVDRFARATKRHGDSPAQKKWSATLVIGGRE